MADPGSIVEQLEEEAQHKDFLFEIAGGAATRQRWNDLKTGLEQRHGLTVGAYYTAYYQKANDAFGPEDDAAGFVLDIVGTWAFLGRKTDSPGTLGFNLLWRDTLGTDLPPQLLFTQYGSLYSGAGAYGENDPVMGELWLQREFRKKLGFRIGKIFPITAYDFFQFKNFRTDFVDFNHTTNATIPLPDNGLGALARYKPAKNVRLTLGIHDANADNEKSGFDTYDGELFTYIEIGFDTGLAPRQPGRPVAGQIHVSLWHQDERENAGVDDGWGVGISASQRFGRYTPFLRFGYADVTAQGPTPVELMANIGVAVDEVFGQLNDRIGIGYTWADPANDALDNQHTIDAYYRIQMTPLIQVSPTLHIVFEPVSNPQDDTVLVWGMRAKFAF